MMKKQSTGYVSTRQKIMMIFLMLLLVFSTGIFSGCGGGSDDPADDDTASSDADTDTDTDADTGSDTDTGSSSGSVADLEDDYDGDDYSWDTSTVTYITLSDSGITGTNSGAVASGSVLTISSAGTYNLTGSLSDGRIIVDTEDEEVVRLIFNGVDIDCDYSAPFYVANAERTAIILADGTSNVLTDEAEYTYFDDEDEPNAALHSKDYLTIGVPDDGSGTGTLTVNGYYNDGITGKDGLVINGGTITVSAPDDGIRGKDYLIIADGTINVTTTDTGDGLLSDNDEDTEKGYILIEDGNITIDSAEDAIQAETYVTIYDGVFDLTSGGGAAYGMATDDDSMKGIKGVAGVVIEGGDFSINSADDAIHSNDFIVVENGIFDIATGDDGLHADLEMEIYDGDFSITESYEGIESAVITIDGGNFYIVSDDDGLNCAGGTDGSGVVGGRDGGMPTTDTGDYYMYLNGGYLAVYAQGDGLDSNGSIEMTGGTVLVHGASSDNAALDYNGTFNISGGFLATAGGTGMGGQSPSSSSTQKYKLLQFSEKSAGTIIHIETSAGTDLVTFKPAKRYSCFLISSPDLETGTTYDVYFNGSYTGGDESDGLYEGGTYSGGTEYSSLSFSL